MKAKKFIPLAYALSNPETLVAPNLINALEVETGYLYVVLMADSEVEIDEGDIVFTSTKDVMFADGNKPLFVIKQKEDKIIMLNLGEYQSVQVELQELEIEGLMVEGGFPSELLLSGIEIAFLDGASIEKVAVSVQYASGEKITRVSKALGHGKLQSTFEKKEPYIFNTPSRITYKEASNFVMGNKASLKSNIFSGRS